MIVKLQRPLVQTSGPPKWMVYNQRRTFQGFINTKDVPAAVMTDMGEDIKGYFEAEKVGGELVFGKRVAAQPW